MAIAWRPPKQQRIPLLRSEVLAGRSLVTSRDDAEDEVELLHIALDALGDRAGQAEFGLSCCQI